MAIPIRFISHLMMATCRKITVMGAEVYSLLTSNYLLNSLSVFLF